MPWGKPHTYICIEPRCRRQFKSTTTNVLRCPVCRSDHNKARILAYYRKKRGDLFGTRSAGHPWSDAQRFNFYLEKTAPHALCGQCGQHMSVCSCLDHDPGLRTYQPVAVPTWKPWK